MSYSQQYKGLIWTNHVLQRLQERKIPQEWAWKAFKFPDHTETGKNKGSVEYVKKYNDVTITLIGKKNIKKEWIILSCWVDPPLPGSVDIIKKKKYWEFKKASFFQKILLSLKYLFYKT